MPLGVSTIDAADQLTAENQARDEHWDDRLTCAGCFCGLATVQVPKYLVSTDWPHYFDNDNQSTVRFVFDNKTMQMAYMQVRTSDDIWAPASKEDCADVLESLQTANEDVFTSPEDYNAEATDVLPNWAAAH